MPHTSPCPECSRTGLPILFTRYAAAFSATKEGNAVLDNLKPRGKLQAEPNGVSLQTAKYNVRMLRTGYLYIRTEAAGIRTPEWLAYVVHPHGYLTKIDIHHPAQTPAQPSCRPSEWGANRSLVWIGDAKAITKLNFMFHPDPIDHDHLVKVIDKAPDTYMQRFDVAGWVQGNTSQDGTCQPGQLNSQVMEFSALSTPSVQNVGNEQYFGLMGCTPTERAWGSYDEQREGRHFTDTAGGAALGPVKGSYAVQMVQAGYRDQHGPRLEGMREYLLGNKGAVVVCEDPIGIAQELSMHHLTAAVPYVRWLHETDAQGVSNQFKQAASASIVTLQSGLQKSIMRAYDRETQAMRWAGTHVAPGSGYATYKVTLPDGSVKAMGEDEYRRYVYDKWTQEADMRDSDRAKFNTAAAAKTAALYDGAARAAFDKLHAAQLTAREQHMDRIAADLQRWLQSDALTDKALGRYNADADPTTSPDGIRCAGQLCAILLQVDSAPKGRQWYADLDTFTPAKKNLVWRMLSLNNAAISAELVPALKLALDPLTYGDRKAQDVYQDAKHQAATAKVAAILGTLTKLLKGADATDKARAKLNDPLTQGMARYGAYWDIGNAAKDNILSVLLSATLARVKKLQPSELEAHIARTQVLLLAHGLGSQAPTFVKSDLTAAIQGKRVPIVLGGLSMLSIIPKLGTAGLKQDTRSISDASASVANGMGLVKGWKASFYEETVFKQVPHVVAAQDLTGKLQEARQKLQSLKADAAFYVVAGTAVGVWWDVVDARTASNEKDRPLTVAYAARTLAGAGTIITTIAGAAASSRAAAIWISRINIYLGIITAVSTFAIGKLKGDAWVNWLLAQPFRVATVKDADKNAFIGKTEDTADAVVPLVKSALSSYATAAAGETGVYQLTPAPPPPPAIPESQIAKTNTKTLFRSEAEMMSKLADVLSEMK